MSYCANCGTPLRDDQQFCAVCGAPRLTAVAAPPMPQLSGTPMPALVGSPLGFEAQVRIGLSLDPLRQSRWSILFRFVLSLPLMVVVAGAGFVGAFVTVGAWFCALFTGRVPDNMQRFLTKLLRLDANVLAYTYLLAGRWPGLRFNQRPDDAVTIDIDHVRLRRWSVFFRVILGWPASVVNDALYLGALPILAVMWIWGIIVGREPRSFHQALALVVRFQLRLQAYASLLTPTQPFRGFLGDGDEKTLDATRDPSLPTSPTPFADSAISAQGSSPMARALPTRWFVTKGAKAAVIVMLVLSVPTYFAILGAESPIFLHFRYAIARPLVRGSYTTTTKAMQQFVVSVSTCTSSDRDQCVAAAAGTAYGVVNAQWSLLSNNFFIPSNALQQADRYDQALKALGTDLLIVESSTTTAAQNTVINTTLPLSLTNYADSYHQLEKKMGG